MRSDLRAEKNRGGGMQGDIRTIAAGRRGGARDHFLRWFYSSTTCTMIVATAQDEMMDLERAEELLQALLWVWKTRSTTAQARLAARFSRLGRPTDFRGQCAEV